jgi:uncharacterized protein (DUF3820 family)
MNRRVPEHFTMSYGKYKGTSFGSLPASYLIYIYENGMAYGKVKDYFEENEETIRMQHENDKKGIK